MGAFLAVLLFLLDLAAFTWLARRVRRRPLPMAAAVGMGLLVAWQAAVSWALSAASAVGAPGLAVAACLPPAAAVGLARGTPGGVAGALRGARRTLRWTVRVQGGPGLLLVPLAALAAVVAFAYAPSNWDSMTYHLARVAHWMQRGSVAPYDTNVYRQVIYPPGAEYLLLQLQALSGTDRLAGGVQLLAWGIVALSAAPLARLSGASRAVAAWAGPIAASAPMLVLQATSTQNDLVAAALALALLAASLPFLHARPRPRPADLVLLGVVAGAAFLVKVTALLAAAPFLLAALPGLWRGARRWRPGTLAAAGLAAVALALAVAGPVLVRMARPDPRAGALVAPYVFPLAAGLGERAAALRAAAGRHLPSGTGVLDDLAGHPATLPPFHEDRASNPVQAAFVLLGLALLAATARRSMPRARRAALAWLGAWLLFQLAFRQNAWISRLEVPVFALLPLWMGTWSALPATALRRGALGAVAALAVVVGVAAAIHNRSRPALQALHGRDPAADYYANRRGPRVLHDAALEVAENLGCRRMGLLIGEDDYDYPLTWRAMQRGIEVRHVVGPDPWPCVLVTERGHRPPDGPDDAPPWRPAVRLKVRSKPEAEGLGGVWFR